MFIHLLCHIYTICLLVLQLKRRVVTIDGYTDVPANNEDLLLQAVAQQPVSVGICGSARAFQLYSKVLIHALVALSLTYVIECYQSLYFPFIIFLFRVSSMAHAQHLLIMLC